MCDRKMLSVAVESAQLIGSAHLIEMQLVNADSIMVFGLHETPLLTSPPTRHMDPRSSH